MTGCSLDMSISDLQSVGDGITPPKIELKIATDVDAGETVPLEISGGVPPYQYSVTGAATLDLTSNSGSTLFMVGTSAKPLSNQAFKTRSL